MHVISDSQSTELLAGAELNGSGPLVYQRDDVPLRLLYLRELWDVGVSPEDAANLDRPVAEKWDPASIEALWLRSWQQAWRCNEIVQQAVVDGTVPSVPDQEPAGWFAPGGPEGFDLDEYLAWVHSVRLSGSRGLQGPRVGLIAEAAAARGLLAIYVVPVEGAWVARSEKLLVVSPEVYDSEDLLVAALESL